MALAVDVQGNESVVTHESRSQGCGACSPHHREEIMLDIRYSLTAAAMIGSEGCCHSIVMIEANTKGNERGCQHHHNIRVYQ